MPTATGERDEVFNARAATCNNDSILMMAGATSSTLVVDKALCVEASMGHPNVKGAQAYTDAITGKLGALLPQWHAVHAPTQRAP